MKIYHGVTPEDQIPIRCANIVKAKASDRLKPLIGLDRDIAHPAQPVIEVVPKAPMVSVGTDCAMMVESEMQTGNDDTYNPIPKRAKVNQYVRKWKGVYSNMKLTTFLKTKYFMKIRDPSIISQMVTDARMYLAKQKRTLDNKQDYDDVVNSVMAAYTVSKEELEFRQLMKKPSVLDAIEHLNKTMLGDLGRRACPLCRGLATVYREGKEILTKHVKTPISTRGIAITP